MFLQFKKFCRESSSRILKETTSLEGVTFNDVTNVWDELTYCCYVYAQGEAVHANFMVFFTDKIISDLVKTAFPWEKGVPLRIGKGLISEYSNMMMAIIKKSLEQVDYLNLGVPTIDKVEGENVTLLGRARKYFPKEEKVLLRDSWALVLKEGCIYNHLRTEVRDIDKFMKGNFNDEDESLQGGNAIIF